MLQPAFNSFLFILLYTAPSFFPRRIPRIDMSKYDLSLPSTQGVRSLSSPISTSACLKERTVLSHNGPAFACLYLTFHPASPCSLRTGLLIPTPAPVFRPRLSFPCLPMFPCQLTCTLYPPLSPSSALSSAWDPRLDGE